MNAVISARLAEVTTDTLEGLAFIFASPVADAPAADEVVAPEAMTHFIFQALQA